MDKLDNGLNANTKQQIHPAIKAAMKLARTKLNRYYSMTDDVSLYRIAMGKQVPTAGTVPDEISFSASSRS
jgi:hypothetical protein